MRNIIKKINAMALAAMLVGGGFAFATTQKAEAPMYKFHNNQWSQILPSESYRCSLNPSIDCTATELLPNGEPSGTIVKGVYTPLN